MKNFILGLMFFSLLTVSGFAGALSRQEATTLFIKAGLSYEEGQFARAAGQYQEIINGGWESGPVYYNLANSYFRAGELGKAVLNFERARRLMPRDSDLEANLSYAMSLTKNPPAVKSLWQTFKGKLLVSFSRTELDVALCVLGLVLASVHLWSLYGQWPGRKRIFICGLLATLFVLVGLVLIGQIRWEKNSAIVIKDSSCKFEPRLEATTYFDVSPGLRVKVLRDFESWAKIERPDGKQGWIIKENVEKI